MQNGKRSRKSSTSKTVEAPHAAFEGLARNHGQALHELLEQTRGTCRDASLSLRQHLSEAEEKATETVRGAQERLARLASEPPPQGSPDEMRSLVEKRQNQQQEAAQEAEEGRRQALEGLQKARSEAEEAYREGVESAREAYQEGCEKALRDYLAGLQKAWAGVDVKELSEESLTLIVSSQIAAADNAKLARSRN